MSDEELLIEHGRPLAPLTTLGLGGPAERFAEITSEDVLYEALRTAKQEDWPITILGGGSNVVVADAGVRGIVLRVAIRGVVREDQGGEALLDVAAGEPWDPFIESTVREGLSGLECLSGIPGFVGGTPVQNVGAYGQEVSERIASVRILDLVTRGFSDLEPADCRFGYRTSRFRGDDARVVTSVRFRLTPGGAPSVRYPELRRALGEGAASLQEVRNAVLALRREKSMVIDEADENRRSVGSFFVNPVVTPELADRVAAAAKALLPEREAPRFPGENGVKLSAAFLIEAAGFRKGDRRGAFGISSRHSLALVHHGGGSAAGLIAFAREIRDGVSSKLGVELRPEPMFLGFSEPPL